MRVASKKQRAHWKLAKSPTSSLSTATFSKSIRTTSAKRRWSPPLLEEKLSMKPTPNKFPFLAVSHRRGRAGRVFVAFSFTLACIFLLGSCQKKEASLNLLVWEGYADPSFIPAFE